MRDKPPAPHFEHILSEEEEHFHENATAAAAHARSLGFAVANSDGYHGPVITGPDGYAFELRTQRLADASSSEPFETVVLRAQAPDEVADLSSGISVLRSLISSSSSG